MTRHAIDSELRERAIEWIEARQGLWGHIAVYLIVNGAVLRGAPSEDRVQREVQRLQTASGPAKDDTHG